MPIKLDPKQKVELSEILETSDWLTNADRASWLVKLVPEVQVHWAAGGSAKMMSLSMVDLSDEYGAVEKLVAALEQLAKGSTATIKARAFLNDVTASTNFSRATRTELMELLDRSSLTPVRLRTLVRRSAPYSCHEAPADTAAAVHHLASLPDRTEGFPYPLIEFTLRASREETVTKMAVRLSQWARTAAQAKKVENELDALDGRLGKEESEESPTVMLRIAPHDDDPKKFSVAMWLWGVEDMAAPRQLPESALSMEQVQAAVNRELSAISEEVETLDIRFEVFVSSTMIDHDFDSWSVQLGMVDAPRPLGEFFPTSVRSLDRLNRRSVHGRWRSKWKQFRTALSAGAAPAFVLCDAACLPNDFRRNLELVDAVMVGFCFAPCGKSGELMNHALDAGVPVGLWLRRDNSDPNLVDHVRALLSKAPNDLPRRLYEQRKKDPANSTFWYSLTVLWDDPDRVPNLKKLTGPL